MAYLAAESAESGADPAGSTTKTSHFRKPFPVIFTNGHVHAV